MIFLASTPETYGFMLEVSQYLPGSKVIWANYNVMPSCQEANVDADLLFRMTQHNVRRRFLDGMEIGKELEWARRWYQHFLTTLTGKTLVVWNGKSLPNSCAVEAARAKGMRVIFLEMGLLPATIHIDPIGIGERAELMSMPLSEEIDEQLVSALRRKKRLQRQLDDEATHYIGNELPEKYLLFLAQCHLDTQITLAGSPYPSLQAAAGHVALVADTLHLPFVIKLHPNDVPWGIVNLRMVAPEAALLVHTPLSQALDGATAVCTLNSSAGVESLLRNKPTIVMGQALYHHCATVSNNPHTLLETVTGATPPDRTLVDRWVTAISKYLIPADDNQRIAQRIEDLCHL